MSKPRTPVDEVARHFGLTKENLYRRTELRHLAARRLGRLLKFKISEFDWLMEGARRCK
jgi:hypothetical protein